MKDLKFLNFIFNKDGWNYTVRLGEDYYNNCKPGDKIRLLPIDIDNNTGIEATIRELIKCHFSCIAQYIYKDEHDPACRTKEGLIEAMKVSYGAKFKMEEDPVVTCIAFTLDNFYKKGKENVSIKESKQAEV
jgi:hypothetical protein